MAFQHKRVEYSFCIQPFGPNELHSDSICIRTASNPFRRNIWVLSLIVKQYLFYCVSATKKTNTNAQVA